MLEDLLIACVNEAMRKADDTKAAEMEKISGGMDALSGLGGLGMPGLF